MFLNLKKNVKYVFSNTGPNNKKKHKNKISSDSRSKVPDLKIQIELQSAKRTQKISPTYRKFLSKITVDVDHHCFLLQHLVS